MLHVAILIGGVAVDAAGEPLYLLLILVAGKTYFDWKLHVKEHRKRAELAVNGGENKRTSLSVEMAALYPRMLALHMAIVFGGFAVKALGQPIFLLIILVIAKTIADWKLHLKAHEKAADLSLTTNRDILASASRERAKRGKS